MPFLKIRCCNRSPKGRLTWRRDDSLLKRKNVNTMCNFLKWLSVCACAQIPLQYCLYYLTRFLWYPRNNTMGWESDRLVERRNSGWISLLSRLWYDNNFILRLKSKPFRELRRFIKTTWWFANYFLRTVYLRGISKTRFPSTPCQKQEVEMRRLSGVQF